MALERAIPQLPSGDLDKTEAFFLKNLGFKTNIKLPDFGFLSLQKDSAEIHFWKTPDEKVALELGSQCSCYIMVKNIPSLFQEYLDRNITFRYPLENKPWGMREFQVDDPFGNAIKFGEKMEDM